MTKSEKNTDTVWLHEMTWEEIGAKLDDGLDTIILPCGSTEQHGPHQPLGTDTLVAKTLAEDGNGPTPCASAWGASLPGGGWTRGLGFCLDCWPLPVPNDLL